MGGSHYEILGLEQSASHEEIRVAYRELARRYHPDQHPSRIAMRLMPRINLAYETLSDVAARAEYDRKLRGEQRPTRSNQPQRGAPATEPQATVHSVDRANRDHSSGRGGHRAARSQIFAACAGFFIVVGWLGWTGGREGFPSKTDAEQRVALSALRQ